MVDPQGRVIDYLRISVTDRCNERCLYCMPEGYKGWSQREDHLTAREIIQTVEAATKLGFRKFRVTGGEPLLRRDILEILRGLRALPGVESLGLSTNATLLAELAGPLETVGLDAINISLDALDTEIYRRVTGGDLSRVLAGIEAARRHYPGKVKLNCVLLRGVNETEFFPLVAFAAEREFPLRFIELMPLSRADVLDEANFLGVEELRQRFEGLGVLSPLTDFRPGHGPAKYYRFEAPGLTAPAKIGFIGALTNPHFCEACNKVRLTADGKLRPCLGRTNEIDLRAGLRAGVDPIELLRTAIANKPPDHAFRENYQPGRPMTAIGG